MSYYCTVTCKPFSCSLSTSRVSFNVLCHVSYPPLSCSHSLVRGMFNSPPSPPCAFPVQPCHSQDSFLCCSSLLYCSTLSYLSSNTHALLAKGIFDDTEIALVVGWMFMDTDRYLIFSCLLWDELAWRFSLKAEYESHARSSCILISEKSS